jgi:hypothetical protein
VSMHPTHAARARVAVKDNDGDAAIKLCKDMLAAEQGQDDGADGVPPPGEAADLRPKQAAHNAIDRAALRAGQRMTITKWDTAKRIEDALGPRGSSSVNPIDLARGRRMLSGKPPLQVVTLSMGVTAMPTSFRLFAKNWNKTAKGDFLFDDVAAKSVMAAYQKHGVDLALDLEHGMLEEPGADPTQRDARAWFKLELRSGELWATAVSWTQDGAARLAEKRQRYISPAFESDPKTKRITEVFNAALTSTPATHNAPALVAASAR